jgi:HEAT repeat protein
MSRSAVLAVVFLLALVALGANAQDAARNPASAPRQISAADGEVVGVDTPAGDAVKLSKPEQIEAAWKMLADAVHDDKHVDLQIEALAALGTLGSNAKSVGLIAEAFKAKDVDTRTAAVLAAGQTRSRMLLPKLRQALDDKDPQIAFAAACALWKEGDHTGEDLLLAVVDGERKASAPLVQGSMHQANREMHNPTALAKMGVETGASMLLGPFGFGVTAYEYIRKNGGESARVQAVEAVSRSRTREARKALEAALYDKDQTVRAAAVKAMRVYRDEKAQHAIAGLFADAKKPVEFSAAAAYLVSSGAVALPPMHMEPED